MSKGRGSGLALGLVIPRRRFNHQRGWRALTTGGFMSKVLHAHADAREWPAEVVATLVAEHGKGELMLKLLIRLGRRDTAFGPPRSAAPRDHAVSKVRGAGRASRPCIDLWTF
jgi:hypothetical protein